MVGDLESLAPPGSRQPEVPHEAFHGATGHSGSFTVEVSPDLGCAVDEQVVFVDLEDLGFEFCVTKCPAGTGGRFLAVW